MSNVIENKLSFPEIKDNLLELIPYDSKFFKNENSRFFHFADYNSEHYALKENRHLLINEYSLELLPESLYRHLSYFKKLIMKFINESKINYLEFYIDCLIPIEKLLDKYMKEQNGKFIISNALKGYVLISEQIFQITKHYSLMHHKGGGFFGHNILYKYKDYEKNDTTRALNRFLKILEYRLYNPFIVDFLYFNLYEKEQAYFEEVDKNLFQQMLKECQK